MNLGDSFKEKHISFYSCGTIGHKVSKCCKKKDRKFCLFFKSSGHMDKLCHKL